MKDFICPCGSGRHLSACCGRYLAGEPAPTAEALMRSRYTAFVVKDADYLLASWHPASRPETVGTLDSPKWLGLTIRKVEGGGPDDTEGTVEFIADCLAAGRRDRLHETSRFVRESGRWLYVDGQIHRPPKPVAVGRNEPCPCGSGRKFKHCCAA